MYRVAWPLTPSSTGYTNPQIWFQDMSCNWFFIAGTFTAYFRLMMVIYSPPASPHTALRRIRFRGT
eukprot:COSAG01_NODE_12_length_41732_cov_160.472964_33_plen_66_part_00